MLWRTWRDKRVNRQTFRGWSRAAVPWGVVSLAGATTTEDASAAAVSPTGTAAKAPLPYAGVFIASCPQSQKKKSSNRGSLHARFCGTARPSYCVAPGIEVLEKRTAGHAVLVSPTHIGFGARRIIRADGFNSHQASRQIHELRLILQYGISRL